MSPVVADHLQRRARLLLVAGVLAAGVGAGLYAVWRADEPARRVPAASGEIDWTAALEAVPDDFSPPSGPWRLRLPGDHGAHPETRTESWVLSAHLRGAAGERLGLQVALLRVALVAPDAPERGSAWAAREVYRGHVVLVSERSSRSVGEERFSRAALGLAGHDAGERRVWLEDWSIRYGEGEDGDRLVVEAALGDTAVEIVLSPEKPAVTANANARGGPFRGFALTRLAAEGEVRRPSGSDAVSGLAWLDHLWGEVPLPVGPVVWDRMQLHLDDGADVSMIRTRRRGGGGQPVASGYRVDAGGGVERLEGAEDVMRPENARRGTGDGLGYPLDWRVRAGKLELDVAPLVAARAHDFSAPIWTGPVTAEGRSGARRVFGAGFLELTGYEDR